MPELILHIGAHKTGTSALQSFLAINAQKLKGAGVFYPPSRSDDDAKLGAVTSGNALHLAKFLCRELHFGFDPHRWPAQFQRAVRMAKGRRILYSSEFLESFESHWITIFKNMAAVQGYDIRLIYYVRNIVDHALSVYAQRVRASALTMSVNHFLRDYRCPFAITIDRARAASIQITVVNFDTARDDLCNHFMKVIGVEPNGFKLPPIINSSLSLNEAEVIRLGNIVSPETSMIRSNELRGTVPGRKIPQRVLRLFVERHRADIAAVNRWLDAHPIVVN